MIGRVNALVAIVVAALVVLVLSPFIGVGFTPLGAVLADGGIESEIFWRMRVPRVISAFIAGGGLAVSGMAFQAMFRNPLATPFTLGVASGASLGAALYVRLGLMFSVLGISGISISAFLGALLSISLVYGLTRLRQGFSTAVMLLAGVAISFSFSSIILFVQYMSDFASSFHIVRWLMGGIESVGFSTVQTVLPFVAVGVGVVAFLTSELNLLALGDDVAASRGVSIHRVKTLLFLATSLMVGGVVAVCGPIGFVGMMAPHMCRLVIGPDHRYLAPATAVFGGAFLTLCDTIARTIIAPAEMPVGVITSLCGGPFFLWLLLGGSSKRGLI